MVHKLELYERVLMVYYCGAFRLHSKFTKMDQLGTDLLVVSPGTSENSVSEQKTAMKMYQSTNIDDLLGLVAHIE